MFERVAENIDHSTTRAISFFHLLESFFNDFNKDSVRVEQFFDMSTWISECYEEIKHSVFSQFFSSSSVSKHFYHCFCLRLAFKDVIYCKMKYMVLTAPGKRGIQIKSSCFSFFSSVWLASFGEFSTQKKKFFVHFIRNMPKNQIKH